MSAIADRNPDKWVPARSYNIPIIRRRNLANENPITYFSSSLTRQERSLAGTELVNEMPRETK